KSPTRPRTRRSSWWDWVPRTPRLIPSTRRASTTRRSWTRRCGRGHASGRAVVGREIFVDTSAWYPIVDRAHPDHQRMARALETCVHEGAGLVTTNLVLAESHALIMRR